MVVVGCVSGGSFDTADYDYALNNYNKMLEAISEAEARVQAFVRRNQVIFIVSNKIGF